MSALRILIRRSEPDSIEELCRENFQVQLDHMPVEYFFSIGRFEIGKLRSEGFDWPTDKIGSSCSTFGLN